MTPTTVVRPTPQPIIIRKDSTPGKFAEKKERARSTQK